MPRALLKARGLSLVEVMVAITIGLILLAVISRVFVSSKTTYNLNEELSRLQENARFALEFIARDLRMAGYMGCSNKLQGSQVGVIAKYNNDAAVTFRPEGIAGYRYVCASPPCAGLGTRTEWEPDLPAEYFADGEVARGSDVILVQRASAFGTRLTGKTRPDNANVQILETSALAPLVSAGDLLMVSNCKSADIFRATGTSSSQDKITIAHSKGAGTNVENFLTHPYGNEAEVMYLVTRAYFVGYRDDDTNNPPALFRKELARGAVINSQELVEGVERLVFQYGLVDASGATQFVLPAATLDYNQVHFVRMGLVARSLKGIDTIRDEQALQVLDVSIPAANDRLRRRVFTSTIELRNR